MNGKSVGLFTIILLLVGVFCSAGLAKLTGAPQMVEHFQEFGYSDSFRLLVGASEVAAALLLLVPRTSAAAAWILVCIMMGATGTHLLHREYLTAVVPLILGALSLVVAFARRPAALRKPYLISMHELDLLWERERQFDSIRSGR